CRGDACVALIRSGRRRRRPYEEVMPVTLSINGHTIADAAARGPSLFEYAESVGVPVPTSCRKNGKCKECIVEIAQGMELLSPPTEAEQHLKGSFRLSCQCHVAAESGL